MKRITSIALTNYRAFYGSYEPLKLPNGENLLLYGENGSGKSSLFRALKSYFESSRKTIPFEKNSYSGTSDGAIKIEFGDFDTSISQIVAGTVRDFEFTSTISTNNVQFIKDADLVKGFLDYRILLQVYLEKDPNLFDLVVRELLYEMIPVGYRQSLGAIWQDICYYIKNLDGRYRNYKWAVAELPQFHNTLNGILKRVFLRLNQFLIRYFKLNLRVWFDLPSITYTWYNRNINSNLRLKLSLNGKSIPNHTEYLNEARLSALSVCLYLASLKENPTNIDYKILFLDDVFIGLDSSNRIPILKILSDEFDGYQIFITTYDRYWFEVAQNFFKSRGTKRWQYKNLYLGREKIPLQVIDKPIIIQNVDNYSKGLYYLHHPTQPDYPASANYFRKFAEETLGRLIPAHELRKQDYSLIEIHKLTNQVNSVLHFLRKIGGDTTLIIELKNALHTLLHPLSHFNLESPIYKGELVAVQSCLGKLESYFVNLRTQYKLFIAPGRLLKLRFQINVDKIGYYDFCSHEAIYLVRDSGGVVSLSPGRCYAICTYVIDKGKEVSRKNFNKKSEFANYISLQDGYEKIFSFITGQVDYSHIQKAANYLSEFEIAEKNVWTPLDTTLSW